MLRRPSLFVLCCLCMSFASAEKLPEDPPLYVGPADADVASLRVGDEPPEGGVYWDYRSVGWHSGELRMNLRFVGSYLKMYFIDEEGKIVAPPEQRGWVWTCNNMVLWRTNDKKEYMVPDPSGACLTSGEGRRPVQPRLWVRPYFLGWTTSLHPDGNASLQTCQTPYHLQLYDWSGK